MYEIETRVEVSAAHRLYYYSGACYRLHGHNYIITVKIGTPEISENTGMIRDFKVAKKQLWDIVSQWDHKTLLNAVDPLVKTLPLTHVVIFEGEPTAECLAKNIGDQLINQERSINPSFCRISVKVQETEKNIAIYIVEG